MLELGAHISKMIFWYKVAIHDLLLAKYHFSNNFELSLLIQSSDVWINRWKVLPKSYLKSLSIKLTAYNAAYSTNNFLVFSCLIFFCCCITYPYAKFFHFKAQLKNIWTASKSFFDSQARANLLYLSVSKLVLFWLSRVLLYTSCKTPK